MWIVQNIQILHQVSIKVISIGQGEKFPRLAKNALLAVTCQQLNSRRIPRLYQNSQEMVVQTSLEVLNLFLWLDYQDLTSKHVGQS
jgi:hypothetical protein